MKNDFLDLMMPLYMCLIGRNISYVIVPTYNIMVIPI